MDTYIDKIIVLYDGECNFCDATVDFILKYEQSEFCYFTHLQSDIGKNIADDFMIPPEYDGLLFLENEQLYGKSEAALRISRYLKFPLPFISFFFWVPLKIRDGFYDWFAKNRYKWYGKKECKIPSKTVQKRFLN